MKVLVACEFSGIVRDAFIARGHNAMSCDLLPTERPGPHYQGDLIQHIGEVCPHCDNRGWYLEHFSDNHTTTCQRCGRFPMFLWDLIVAFPPCTHLASSGAVYWPSKRQDGRQQAAVDFVLKISKANSRRIAIENPVGFLSSIWRKPDQIIEPFMFGDPYRKRTCLWLKNLPLLKPTNSIVPIAHWHGGSRRGGLKKDGTRTPSKLPTMLKYGWKNRSRTFQGIANAMAEQWG